MSEIQAIQVAVSRIEPTSSIDDVAEITLSRGLTAIVDAADAGWLGEYSWYAQSCAKGFYAATRPGRRGSPVVLMHRLIVGAQRGQVVDHANRNRLDNRRANLRLCTQSQNAANTTARFNKFKGVFLTKDTFWSRITVSGKPRYLGSFATAEEAAAAYDTAAREAFGEFALCNFGVSR